MCVEMCSWVFYSMYITYIFIYIYIYIYICMHDHADHVCAYECKNHTCNDCCFAVLVYVLHKCCVLYRCNTYVRACECVCVQIDGYILVPSLMCSRSVISVRQIFAE